MPQGVTGNPGIIRPRASAGLVLLREDPGGLSVLLGRRSASARFMPSVYVVPGGGLTQVDRLQSGFPEPLCMPPGGLDAATRLDLLPFARAALRESFEETGALLGETAARPPQGEDRSAGCQGNGIGAPHWRAYRKRFLMPAFGSMTLIARAITPAGSPIRYHTRFFMADGVGLEWGGPGDGELEDIGWCPVGEAFERPLPEITTLVIEEAMRRWRGPANPRPVPLYYCRGDRILRRSSS